MSARSCRSSRCSIWMLLAPRLAEKTRTTPTRYNLPFVRGDMPAGGMPSTTFLSSQSPMSYLHPPRFLLLQPARGQPGLLQRQGAERHARLRQAAREGTRARRAGQSAHQLGQLPRPLRRRPVHRGYPEEVWYTLVDEQDIDEIIEEHLWHGRVVERLKL